MNKILSVLVLSLLFLVSCNEEETTMKTAGNYSVNILVKLPSTIVPTRSQIGVPVDYQMRTVIEVWQGTSELVYKEEKLFIDGNVDISFNFTLPDGNYDCLIWTDLIKKDATFVSESLSEKVTYIHYEDLFYNTSDLHQITVNGDGTNLMDTDLCDAYVAKVELSQEQSEPYTITLERPFGKLIIKEKEIEQFKQLSQMEVSYTIPKIFNVSTNEPENEMLTVNGLKTFDGEDTSCKLFSTYAFSPSSSAGKALNAISFAFTKSDGKQVECEIPQNTLFVKRNMQTTASGSLVKNGDEEPVEKPEVGYFFFKNGTWGSELTESNKGNCVGIVYAVGQQNGDNIADYGVDNAEKEILGYVLSLQRVDLEGYSGAADIANNNTSGRVHFYDKSLSKEKYFIPEGEIDREKHNGYAETEKLLSSSFYKEAPEMYLPLYILAEWREQNKVVNASDWYFPTLQQVMTLYGKYDGLATDYAEGVFQKTDKDPAITAALEKAQGVGINAGIDERRIVNVTLHESGFPVEVDKRNGLGYKENRGAWAPSHIRPILTILKAKDTPVVDVTYEITYNLNVNDWASEDVVIN